MKIAFIGQKGVPVTFGGVEYHVDALSAGLAARGHDVTAYVRSWYTPKTVKSVNGVKLVHVPTLRTKHLDASVHSLLCSLHVIFRKVDIVHYHGIGPAVFSLVPRLLGRRVVVTVHRLDWQTEKWGRVARAFLKLGEYLSARIPHRTIVVSEELQRYFRARYGIETVHLSHGIHLPYGRPPAVIHEKYGLRGMDYVLFMGRLVPEKRVDWLVRSYLELADASTNPLPSLVIAGGSSATDRYVKELERDAQGNKAVMFTGYVSGAEKEELLSNALVFVLPSYLEGFPIVLLEAKSYGVCCLASDIAPHKEALSSGVDGMLFRHDDHSDLTRKLEALLSNPARARALGASARAAVSRRPGWDEIVERTLGVYRDVLGC